ncbi:MAG: DUF1993 domain-containing protein [Aestuariivirga sp.]
MRGQEDRPQCAAHGAAFSGHADADPPGADCHGSKGSGARLAGIANPSFPDEEKTFAELQARIAKALDFLGSLKREQFADAATRTVTIKVGGKDVELKGAAYLTSVALPNFYFHVTTAYNILRHNGLEIGKGDFLGRNLS